MNDVVAEYPFHKGARGALYFAAVLCIFLIVTIPFAAWCFYRIGKAKVTITRTGVRAQGLIMTDAFDFADVARIGTLKIPLAARGIGGAVANAKLKGLGYGLNLVVKTKAGKEVKFITNQYENHEELIERISKAVPVPLEEVQMGILSHKWPERAAG